jgi:hypothetical protein
MTAFMIWATVRTALLLGGRAMFVDMKKCHPALLLALDSDRYDALLCPARTMLLA